MMGKKPISKIKELKKYERKIDGSEIPPIYDLEKMGAIHQEIDAAIRPFWENLHPVVQDFITTWNDSWNSLLHEKGEHDSQLRQKANLVANLKSNFENKIREINSEISTLKTDIQAKETEVAQKEHLIQDLESTDKDHKLGISQLRENLESRLKTLNEQLSDRQKKYEETQMQVGQSFQNKVLELDSEIMSLNEQISEKDAKIKELEDQVKTISKETQKSKFYEEKSAKLEKQLEKIQGMLKIDDEEDVIDENG